MKRTMIPLAMVAAVNVVALAGEGQAMTPRPGDSKQLSSTERQQRTHFSFEKRGKLIP